VPTCKPDVDPGGTWRLRQLRATVVPITQSGIRRVRPVKWDGLPGRGDIERIDVERLGRELPADARFVPVAGAGEVGARYLEQAGCRRTAYRAESGRLAWVMRAVKMYLGPMIVLPARFEPMAEGEGCGRGSVVSEMLEPGDRLVNSGDRALRDPPEAEVSWVPRPARSTEYAPCSRSACRTGRPAPVKALAWNWGPASTQVFASLL
jgi:hypothetical protein